MPRITAAMVLLGATACTPDKGSGASTSSTVTSDGTVSVKVEVNDQQSAFMVTSQADKRLALDSIVNPDGEMVFNWQDWYSAPTYLTAAVWPLATDMVLNWPVRAQDGQLSEGDWEIIIAAVSEEGVYLDGVDVESTVLLKTDARLSSGEVKVVIAYAEGVEEDAEVVGAVEASVERWQSVWAPFGLTVRVRYAIADIDKNLPYVGDGSSEVAELSDQIDWDEILMIVGETIRSEELYYGVSGNIPGSLISTPRSAVTIGWLANTGLDGSFSASDIRLMGETMAHETSHYMGLFHPVETTFEVWDAASDTPNCITQASCEQDLGTNLMFPYPVCGAISCTPQDELSDIQVGIAHRYTGTQ